MSHPSFFLNVIACSCMVIAFIVVKYGVSDTARYVKEAFKKHISG